MTDQTSQTIGIGPLFGAGLLVLTALFSLCSQCVCQADPTETDDWNRAADAVVERAEPTDAIRVHPTWSEAPLPQLREVGNLLHRHERPYLEDLVGIERLWILTESSRRTDAVAPLPFDASADRFENFGTVDLLEVDVPADLRLESALSDRLDDADVEVRSDGDVDDQCRRRATDPPSYRCEDGTVESTLLEVEDDPRRCIRSDPPSGDRHLAVEAPLDVDGDVLRIRAGLDRRAARLERGGDVVYRLFADDQQIADERVDGHTSEWTAHDVETDDLDGPTTRVRLEVESVDPSPHHRRFCFNAWSLTDDQAD